MRPRSFGAGLGGGGAEGDAGVADEAAPLRKCWEMLGNQENRVLLFAPAICAPNESKGRK